MILQRWLADLPALGVIAASLGLTAVAYIPIAAFSLAERDAVGARRRLRSSALAVVCTAIAFLLFFALIAEIGPVRATVITYVNPAVAAVLGVTILDEDFTVGMGVGFVLVLAGSVLATRPAGRGSGRARRRWRRALGRSARGQDQLEAGPALGRLVQDLAAVRLRVGLRDRQAEAGPCGVLAPREALEQERDELLGHTVAVVLHGQAEVALVGVGADLDVPAAVADRVRDEVGDDALEGRRVCHDVEVVANLHLDLVRMLARDAVDHVLQARAHGEALRLSGRDTRVEPREVEQLLDHPVQPHGLLVQDGVQLGEVLPAELAASVLPGSR